MILVNEETGTTFEVIHHMSKEQVADIREFIEDQTAKIVDDSGRWEVPEWACNWIDMMEESTI